MYTFSTLRLSSTVHAGPGYTLTALDGSHDGIDGLYTTLGVYTRATASDELFTSLAKYTLLLSSTVHAGPSYSQVALDGSHNGIDELYSTLGTYWRSTTIYDLSLPPGIELHMTSYGATAVALLFVCNRLLRILSEGSTVVQLSLVVGVEPTTQILRMHSAGKTTVEMNLFAEPAQPLTYVF